MVLYLFEFHDSEEALLKLAGNHEARKHSRQQGVRMHPGASSARCRSRTTARSSAIHPVPLRAPPSDQVPQEQHATLILGPPSRLPYIEATMQQLQDKGVETDFRRPAEPAVVSHIGTNLGKLWEVYVARQARGEH